MLIILCNLNRQIETPQQREERLKKNCAYARMMREKETPEQRASRLKKNCEAARRRRAKNKTQQNDT